MCSACLQLRRAVLAPERVRRRDEENGQLEPGDGELEQGQQHGLARLPGPPRPRHAHHQVLLGPGRLGLDTRRRQRQPRGAFGVRPGKAE